MYYATRGGALAFSKRQKKALSASCPKCGQAELVLLYKKEYND